MGFVVHERHQSGRPPSTVHIPALDGIRGLAILLVTTFHFDGIFWYVDGWRATAVSVLHYGYLGVDLFFVLSGFLITGILLDNRAKYKESGAHSAGSYFSTFYWRRLLRIFPVYYFYLLLICVGLFIATRIGRPVSWSPHWGWYILYLQNLQPGMGVSDLYLSHLWSLAVEEQFYLVWPLAVWFLQRRWLPWLSAALIAFALSARVYVGPGHDILIWQCTPFRLDSLGSGSLLAVLFRSARARQFLSRGTVLAVWAALGLAWYGIAQPSAFPTNPQSNTPAAIIFAALVFYAATHEPASLRSRLLRVFGKYSYAIYVFHLAAMVAIGTRLHHILDRQPAVISATASILFVPLLQAFVLLLAMVSWRFLESPFLRLKDRYPRRPVALESRVL